MANVRNGNTFFVDTSSNAGVVASYIAERNVKVVGIFVHGVATTDEVLISDKSATAAAVGSTKLVLLESTAKEDHFFDLSGCPILFPNGIWVTVTGTPRATLILQNSGS